MKGRSLVILVLLASPSLMMFAAPAPKGGQSPDLAIILKWGGRISANSVAFSPDAKTVATTSNDRAVRFWDARSGKCVKTIEGPHKVDRQQGQWGRPHLAVFSPDGKTIATASDDQAIRLWDAKTGKSTGVLRGTRATGSVAYLAFSTDGKTLASGARGVRLWDITKLKEKSAADVPDCNQPFVGFDWRGRAMALGRGRTSKENRYDTVYVHDAETGKVVLTLKGHEKAVSCTAFSPDGKAVVTSAWDHTVRLWSLATGRQLAALKLPPLVRAAGLAVTPDAKTLAVVCHPQENNGTGDRHPRFCTVRLYDVKSGKELWEIKGRGKDILAGPLAFSPDGQTLAIGLSLQGAVQLWKLPPRAKK